jgi:hypothetical protein
MAERQASLRVAGRQMQSEDHLPVVRQNAELSDFKARELPAPVYEGFTEGFDTRDLKEAETLISELAS